MNKIGHAIGTINRINELANRDRWVNSVHPLVKFLLTIVYIVLVVGCPKYDVIRVLGFAIYPLILFPLANLSFGGCLKRIWVILPLVCLVGAVNPLLDPILVQVGVNQSGEAIIISAGWLSMITLIGKGILTVIAAYLLVATTTIEMICYALQLLHVPKLLITQVLLTYRYISLLLQEAERVTQAYSLRAPNQKGVHYKVWGSLVGQMMLKNIDRANAVYESMLLRGYDGSFSYMRGVKETESENNLRSLLYLAIWLLTFICLYKWPLLYLIGRLFT